MNQILIVKNKKNNNNSFYKFQLYFSIAIILFIIISFILRQNNIRENEKISKKILDNYSITRLYSNNTTNYGVETSANSTNNQNIIGIIQIPKINISYPVFSNLTDELLKISPCRFNGTMPDTISNLCIAGHNYDNEQFFSNLNKLNLGDDIYIYDNNINKYQYKVIDIYEVDEMDWSPIKTKKTETATLTLMTCNNKNKKRLIVKSNLQKNKK